MKKFFAVAAAIAALALAGTPVGAQSGRNTGSERGKEVLPIIVEGGGGAPSAPLRREAFDFYDGGSEQTLETLTLDQAPARIALLVDNTKGLRATTEELKAAAHAMIDELYEGDQMMVVGYEQSAYILQEFTRNLDALDATANDKFQRQGFPKLFDALSATVDDAFGGVGSEKRAIVLVSDGYDSGSKEKFEKVLATLQRENIVVYVLQVTDRTRNASRLDGPKPQQAVRELAEGTGGRVFPFADAASAAKVITEELRLNWYRAVYAPRGVDRLSERSVLIIKKDDGGPAIRAKAAFPGRITKPKEN